MKHCCFFFTILWAFFSGPAFGAEDKLSLSAEMLGQRENILSIKLSPSGNRVASLRNFRGKISLVTQSMLPEEKDQYYVTAFKEGEFKWVEWLNDDRLAVSLRFGAKRFGTKNTETRLFAQDWDKKNVINLVKTQRLGSGLDIRKWVSQFQDDVVSFLPDDPDHILLALDGKEMNYPDVYRVNIHDAKRKRVLKTRSNVMDWRADKDGIVRLGVSQHKSRQRLIYRGSEEDSWKTIARYDVVDDDIPFSVEAFSSDPKVIYVSKLNDHGFNAYYKYDLGKGEFIEEIASRDDADITDLNIDEDGNVRSYTYLDDVHHRVHEDKLWQSMSKMLAKNFPDQEAYVASYSKDKQKFIIKVSAPQNPGDYYFLDLDRKILHQFAEVYPGLDDSKLSPMESISYTARDGLEIPGYLSLPLGVTDPKGLPTVILPHGGPFARDYYGFDYMVQLMTSRGYAVLQMNYRGSTGFGANFEALGRNEWGGKMVDDITDGARWMIDQGYTDPNRLCIVGWSYGGYAALQSLVKEPGLYKCSVAMAPVTDMSTLFHNARKFLNLKDTYLPYIRNEEGSLSDISPYHHIDKIDVPVLVAHGTEDRSVEFKQGEMFAKRMKKKKKNIRFIKFEDGDHYLSLQKHRVKFLSELEKFLKKNL